MNVAFARDIALTLSIAVFLLATFVLVHEWKKSTKAGRAMKFAQAFFGLIIASLTFYANYASTQASAPRHLSDAQFRTIEAVAELSPKIAQVGFLSQYPDSHDLAEDIARALRDSGWTVSVQTMIAYEQSSEIAVTVTSQKAALDGKEAQYVAAAFEKAGFSTSYQVVGTTPAPMTVVGSDGKTQFVTATISINIGERVDTP